MCVHPNETLTEASIPQPIYWPLLALPTIGLMSPTRRTHVGETVRCPAVGYYHGSNLFSHGEMGSLLGVHCRQVMFMLVLTSPSATCHHVIMPARHAHVGVQVICPASPGLHMSSHGEMTSLFRVCCRQAIFKTCTLGL